MKDKLITNHADTLRRLLSKVSVVYTDLDNTLLGPGASLFSTFDHQYSLEPAQSLVGLYQQNVDVVMVSGRNNGQLREVARLLGLSNYIAELGCLTFYNRGEEIITNHNYPVPEGMNLRQAITESGAPGLLLDHFSGRLEYHTPWSERQECTHLFRGLIDIKLAQELLDGKGFSNLKLMDNGECRRPGELKPSSQIRAYHLLPKEAGKAAAIAADLERREIPVANAVALGDSLADLEMAKSVGTFFLVGDGYKRDSRLCDELLSFENAFVTTKMMGLGWAEVAKILLSQ